MMVPAWVLLAIGGFGIAGIVWLAWQAIRPALEEWRTLQAIARNLLGEEDDRHG
jgi:threonine/homoserine/homoserine lactone efflux protein